MLRVEELEPRLTPDGVPPLTSAPAPLLPPPGVVLQLPPTPQPPASLVPPLVGPVILAPLGLR